MDCVGCDKCKLWGKLQVSLLFKMYLPNSVNICLFSIFYFQTQGLGTALKILYSEKLNQATERGLWDKPHIEAEPLFRLTRTEIVALFNAFGRYVL